jgi:hypothetical protein
MFLYIPFLHVYRCSLQSDKSLKTSKLAADDGFAMDLMMERKEKMSSDAKEKMQRHLQLMGFAHESACLFFNPKDLSPPPPEWKVREINSIRLGELRAAAIKNPAQVFAAPIQAVVIMRTSPPRSLMSHLLVASLFCDCQTMISFTPMHADRPPCKSCWW